MTTSTTKPPVDAQQLRANLQSTVQSIRETLESCSAEAELTGFYPERGWRAMEDSGLLNLKVPEVLGGYEADPVTQLQVIEEIASIDGAAGWTYFIGMGSLALITGWLPEEGLDALFVDGRLPRAAFVAQPSGRAVPVDGGFRVSGRWQFASASNHSERIGGMCLVEGDLPPKVLACMVRTEDVTLHDNWKVNGLKGTGSQDFSIDDMFVPHERMFDFTGPAARGGALYRIGVPGFSMMEHGGFALGIGRHIIAAMTVLAQTKMRGIVPTGIASKERLHYDLGRSQIKLDAARSQMHSVAQTAWEVAQDGEATEPPLQLALRCSAIYATEVAAEICQTLFRYAGGKSLYVGSAVEQCLRDIQAGAQHGLMNPDAYEGLGQVALGFTDIALR